MKTIIQYLFLIVLLMNTANAQNLKQVVYKDGMQKLNGLVTENETNKLPGVLILPAWKGADNEAKQAALDLSKEGYIAFIADIYGEGNYPTNNAEAAKIAGKYKSDYAAYQKRIDLALKELIKADADPSKIAVIGYCFGGTGALEAARAQLAVVGVVSIHGGLAKDLARKNIPLKTKVLVEHPADDESVKQEDISNLVLEMNEGKTDWQMITYANSKHTFTNPESPDYNKVMADRAWQHTLLFLKEVLK
ncbi:dienelactone hydrolase family protein [Empedobacter sp. 225-1]|uniref:dienelactone hydrolase family protein n=1 Tax=unclassified Empedobacter TaxID=2643773 RepID=UPI002576FA31|nr:MULTISPECIES: dienelactone hydrolase family protein [unclassified Empedobacter]MDM1524186.1 dienelactone hydrolase family protein [Empedobacter sp. 225-1]MDM1544112.1 dienelactone hydrolase family protein [Empedobacter sp. 189-2]